MFTDLKRIYIVDVKGWVLFQMYQLEVLFWIRSRNFPNQRFCTPGVDFKMKRTKIVVCPQVVHPEIWNFLTVCFQCRSNTCVWVCFVCAFCFVYVCTWFVCLRGDQQIYAFVCECTFIISVRVHLHVCCVCACFLLLLFCFILRNFVCACVRERTYVLFYYYLCVCIHLCKFVCVHASLLLVCACICVCAYVYYIVIICMRVYLCVVCVRECMFFIIIINHVVCISVRIYVCAFVCARACCLLLGCWHTLYFLARSMMP